MEINNYDYVEPKGVDGKIILTCFPGRERKKISFIRLLNKETGGN